MQLLNLTLKPQSAFASALFGDTLFGQLCWVLRDCYGEKALTQWLEGYTQAKPFLVISDAFPKGYLPRPSVPHYFLHQGESDPDKRKIVKKQIWLPTKALNKPMLTWQNQCVSDKDVVKKQKKETSDKYQVDRLQPHNSINRITGTTSKDSVFAPYGMQQYWFLEDTRLSLYLALNTERLSIEQLKEALEYMGNFGFGRDASIGMGKFSIESLEVLDENWRTVQAKHQPNAYFTLAPCAPQGLGFDNERSFYTPFTRFGRHGNIAVHKTAKPFKNPILMAKAGAIFTPKREFDLNRYFIGQGLGGVRKDNPEKGILSHALAETVHQAYSPVLPVHLPDLVN